MTTKIVKTITGVKYSPSRKKAHLRANRKEKNRFGEVLRVKGLNKDEFAGTFDKNGNILINKKVPIEEIPIVKFHEENEKYEQKRILGRLK